MKEKNKEEIKLVKNWLSFAQENLRCMAFKPDNVGIVVLLSGLGLLLASKIGSEYFLQRFSFIVVLFGAAVYLCGRSFTKEISIPLVYLTFMIPLPAVIWNKIAFPISPCSGRAMCSIWRKPRRASRKK